MFFISTVCIKKLRTHFQAYNFPPRNLLSWKRMSVDKSITYHLSNNSKPMNELASLKGKYFNNKKVVFLRWVFFLYRLILQFRCWDKNAVSCFHQLLQKSFFDLNHICTTVPDYNRDVIAKIVEQDSLYVFFKLIFTVVSISSLRNVQSVPLIWLSDPE